MAPETADSFRHSIDLKSAQLPVVAVQLKTVRLEDLASELAQRMRDDPGFFDNDPVVIDLGGIRDHDQPLDFPGLLALLRRHRMRPAAVRGGSPAQMTAAHDAGLALAADAPAVRAPRPETVVREVEVEVVREVQVPGPGTMIIDRPLRSGQQVYARGGDLVVLAMVSYGAEVIADGNVHVYAPLRGRAIAGARGDTGARIFTTCMEAQLVSVAGIYRTIDTALPANVQGKPAQVRLEGEKLLVDPL